MEDLFVVILKKKGVEIMWVDADIVSTAYGPFTEDEYTEWLKHPDNSLGGFSDYKYEKYWLRK